MLTVQITYISGKIETVEMKTSDYTKNLVSLTKEGRLLEMKIVKCH